MLALQAVTHRYRSDAPPALAGVSLRIAAGERIALLGPSGAGKSTLLRCLNGLVTPSEGEAIFHGRRLNSRDLRSVRRSVAMVFQQFNLIESYTALGNALVGAFGRYPFYRTALGLLPADEVAAARRALERVGIGGLAGTPVQQLSGGQRQRVAVARALVQGASVLLGDEPVASLDPGAARSVMELLLELNQREGMTLVLSLHDPNLAVQYCDRVIAISDGRIAFDRPAASLTAWEIEGLYHPGGRPETAKPSAPAIRCRP